MTCESECSGGDGDLINLGVFLAGEQGARKQISKRVEERLRQRQRAHLTLHEIQIQVTPGGGRMGKNRIMNSSVAKLGLGLP